MPATYAETSNQTPTFFVLFAGVDPTPWVEGLGKEKGITFEKGNFKNISMGQGQEAPAEAIVANFAKNGGWVSFNVLFLACVFAFGYTFLLLLLVSQCDRANY
jgi:dynein heavy chain